MEVKKTDLRIVKTKKSVYEALLLLMETQSFEEIKISDLCEKAMINRSTFYAHFEDKYMLFDSLIKDLRDRLQEELAKNHEISNSKEYYMEVIRLLLEHAEKEKLIYHAIMMNNRNSIAMDMIYDTINEDIKQHIESFEQKSQEIPSDLVAHFYLGAILNVGMEWIRNPEKYNKEELFTYLNRLIPEW